MRPSQPSRSVEPPPDGRQQDRFGLQHQRVMVPSTQRDIHIYYHRPPNRTDRFVHRLVQDDPWVKITFAQDIRLDRPLEIGGETVLKSGADAVWFTFPGEWHDIGRFHLADGRLTGIYANVLIPCTFEPGGVWHTTDLFLDLWIPAHAGKWNDEGRAAPEVLDSEELRQAEAAGWVGPELAARARTESERLDTAARIGAWPPRSVHEWTRERTLSRLAEIDLSMD